MRYEKFYLLALIISSYTFLQPRCANATRIYWQQDVSYQMDVRLGDDGRTLYSNLVFTYKNNSPDTLHELRFHAHYNAAKEGSPTDRRRRYLGDDRLKNASEDEYGSLQVSNVRDEEGSALEADFNFSIFRLPLNEPLSPGEETKLSMDFTSRIPKGGMLYRSSVGLGQLKIAHWYPQVCVYDPTMGWVDNQYLGRGEAYGEFGTYDVSITLPEPFIVGATGVLTNRDEVLPEGLLNLLDLSNYANWPWGEQPANKYGDESKTKSWRFHAENVHDFSWVADPQFRIDHTRCGSTDIWILARQDHASGWQDAAEVTRQGMEILEREVGPFPYPEFTVTDCFSGMEYPGIVFCGGRTPRYKLLIWHEMAHNYFMGALGSNQTDRPFMDEGFTTYMEIRIMDEVLGVDNIFRGTWGPWTVLDKDRWARALRPYLVWQKSGFALPLHIESDLPYEWFQYRVSSYYKPTCLLFALEYLLGRKKLQEVLKNYYAGWKYRHPYEGDFFRSAEVTLGMSLQWFYEAWVRGTKDLDYAISRESTGDPGKIGIRVIRKEDMILPVKVGLFDDSGNQVTYYIPIDSEATPPDCDLRLPRWDQLRDPYLEYTFVVDKSSCDYAVLDPQKLLADVNPLNNATSIIPPLKWEFDYPLYHVSPVSEYRLRWSPTAFYNGIDGLQVGAYLKGDYLEEWSNLNLALRVGTLTGNVATELSYQDDLPVLGRGSSWEMSGYLHEGHRGTELKLEHQQKRGHDQPVKWRGSIRWALHEMYDSRYLPQSDLWEDGLISAWKLDGGLFPRLKGLKIEALGSLEVDAPLSDFSYYRGSVELIADRRISRPLLFKLRGFWGIASNGTPLQARYGLGGSGPLNSAASRWLRSWASLPPNWYVRAEGEGNLSGYCIGSYIAQNVASLQVHLSSRMRFLERWVNRINLPPRFRPEFDAFIFAGAGDVGDIVEELRLKDIRKEAGMGLSVNLPAGSELSLDFPIYLSEPLVGEESWAWRTVLSFKIRKNWDNF
ncbi:hypothetical protein CEE37_12425 [candidate division LCP-89 bacterium B3_LCP]|uniref:Peptidase M1 membrane alanine aminopeptidase domain-containing protein n=1 Tax=candidate division LCP-89 bacterium B3_LCP TaxID=2012998 RepID=A0A532UUM7_UNCL8|nr:MAG: hypothetical protein CEE37_12425 [candidate division LCP-89 bacterium B3_LCP]